MSRKDSKSAQKTKKTKALTRRPKLKKSEITSLNKKINHLEKSLQEKVFFYKNLISKLPGSIYWKDKNFSYLGCNNNMAKQVGLDRNSDIVGLTDFDLSWRDKAKVLIQNDKEVMESNSVQIFEETGQLATGEIITVLTHKIPLTDEQGHVIGVLGTSLDISELKLTQKKLEASKEAR